jgi:glycosyltransferase involved in cell wall biosynthesis
MVAPTSFFADYGCHVRILEEVRALQARGRIVRVCTYHNGSNLPDIDIHRSIDVPWLRRTEVGSSRHKAYLDVALTVETLRQAWRFRPDIIHGHLHEGALIGALIGRLLNRPVIFDYQGSLTEEMLDHQFIRKGGLREHLTRRLERVIDALPSAIVTSGEPAAQYLLKRGVPQHRITTIADGVDLRRINVSSGNTERNATRVALGISPDAPVVIYLGLLAEYQGTSLLIDVARTLLERRPEMYFVIAGYPGADLYKRQTAAFGIDHRVLFPGRVPYADAPALLAAGDVAVAPKLSLTESNGKVLNYMAMGLPVVALDTPANRALLGSLGRLVAPGDVAGFAREVERALADGPEVSQAMRERVATSFSWDQRVLELEEVYGRVLNLSLPASTQHASTAMSVTGGSEP